METVAFTTKIWLGTDSLAGLAGLENQRLAIIADPYVVESGMITQVTSQLKKCPYLVFSDIIADPPVAKIIAGIKAITTFEADGIVTIGGGSAIDAAKAMKYFINQLQPGTIRSLIVIPTTSGTGSEVTNFSVITIPETGTKFPLVTDAIQPDIAILDAALTAGVPPKITADTGMDVLTHVIEAYVSTKANAFADAYCEKACKLVFEYLSRAYHDGADQEAREQLHIASTMAGLAFNVTSLGLNHGIAHAAGARLHVPHGRLNAVLLPSVIRYNAQLESVPAGSGAAQRYLQLANCLGAQTKNPRLGVNFLIRKIEELRKKLEMPSTLTEYGITHQLLAANEAAIIEGALADGCTETNPVKATAAAVKDILAEIA